MNNRYSTRSSVTSPVSPPTATSCRGGGPGARLARVRRGGALVLGVLLIGVGLVHPSAAGEAIAVAGYLVLVGAVAAVLDARRRRGLRPAWSRLWRLLARRSTTPNEETTAGRPGRPPRRISREIF
jgi:hypothetical protein